MNFHRIVAWLNLVVVSRPTAGINSLRNSGLIGEIEI
jgi:hypothetical protein